MAIFDSPVLNIPMLMFGLHTEEYGNVQPINYAILGAVMQNVGSER